MQDEIQFQKSNQLREQSVQDPKTHSPEPYPKATLGIAVAGLIVAVLSFAIAVATFFMNRAQIRRANRRTDLLEQREQERDKGQLEISDAHFYYYEGETFALRFTVHNKSGQPDLIRKVVLNDPLKQEWGVFIPKHDGTDPVVGLKTIPAWSKTPTVAVDSQASMTIWFGGYITSLKTVGQTIPPHTIEREFLFSVLTWRSGKANLRLKLEKGA